MQKTTLLKPIKKDPQANYPSPELSFTGDSSCSSEDLEAIYDPEQTQFILNCEYREIYLDLEKKVYHSLSKANSQTKIDTWEIDIQIALIILSESPLSCRESDFNEVKKVISNSDQIIEWFYSLPESECRIQVCEYILQIYNWAEKLHQWRSGKIDSTETVT